MKRQFGDHFSLDQGAGGLRRTADFCEERDGCAIVAIVDKRGRSTHASITGTIDALQKMGHRSGDIHGEGDGCGIATDIPRALWERHLTAAGLSPHLAESSGFFVGHFLLPPRIRSQAEQVIARIKNLCADQDTELLAEVHHAMRESELGPRARSEAPMFWQVAGMLRNGDRQLAARNLYSLQLELERQLPEVHVASLSLDSVVYKLQGIPDMLPRVYPELMDEDMRSVICQGHSRYSTNTLPSVTLSQPFSVLCHNGEINTVDRLRDCGRALGIEHAPGSSDSQSLNRVMEGLIHLHGLDVVEALEMLFPPVPSEIRHYSPELQQLYTFYRWFFPCSAQGPAAVIARSGDLCLGSVDALGLRPLWFVESDYDYVFSSEKGVVDLKRTISDPKPLAPGEKILIAGGRGRKAEVLDYGAIQQWLRLQWEARQGTGRNLSGVCMPPLPAGKGGRAGSREGYLPWKTPAVVGQPPGDLIRNPRLLGAFGWQQYDLMIREKVAREGREVIGSLGHTGPLASFGPEALPNIADYFKENVAVVTNPAIDRERESEHFSTRVILGSRPTLEGVARVSPVGLASPTPLLLGGNGPSADGQGRDWQELGRKGNVLLLEEVLDYFTGRWRDPGQVAVLNATWSLAENLAAALARLHGEARRAVEKGAVLLVLDDSQSFRDNRVYIDPALAVASLHEYLVANRLRRKASIIIRSAAIRNLHDIMFVLGLGADALNPYFLWQVAGDFADEAQPWQSVMRNTLLVLQKGMEKVMSTMGIHELGGYGRIFSAIGLAPELAAVLRTGSFYASETAGLTFAELQEMAKRRYARAVGKGEAAIHREAPRNPRVGKVLRQAALGSMDFLAMSRELGKIDLEQPTGIRHLLAFREGKGKRRRPALDQVDISVGTHAMPLVIAAMSFGSQGENSFRAYAGAAKAANIVCMNGEGGEIPDMLGRFRENRGQQIASGRFGVSMEFLNSADFLEIKIGQGAKPGEGGHLPGSKVTPMVAAARHCKAGTTLISPANHHDIYSIEDLAQIITELKTANPAARISVKIPVTSGVGTIAVGIAKAGADIVNISGYEGGTGAAREHSKRHVGLPVEIGVSHAHRALLEAGLRPEVEIWADGGLRSGADVLKMVLLGANRVGLGTAVLMGIGCISCRRCHLDRCPRGISTQLGTIAAAEARGVMGFRPRDVALEVENLTRLLHALGDEVRYHLAELGETRLQDLPGRTDLLVQSRLHDRLNLRELLARPAAVSLPAGRALPWVMHKPLDYLTKLMSDLTMHRFAQGEAAVHFAEKQVRSTDRAVGTYLAGAMVRKFGSSSGRDVFARFDDSVPGNGLFAFTIDGVNGVVAGGSQDGAAKGSSGGSLTVLKGRNLLGRLVDGSTGKSFAYGAIGGLFFVQNMADSRACIRMSGAEVVFGARIRRPVDDRQGNIASRAHLKGFAFEYMTGGKAIVLGDPGPWLCAGMTGGVIYQCLYPEFGFDRDAVRRRLAGSARVRIRSVSKKGLADISRLLERYIAELENSQQAEEAAAVAALLLEADRRFVMLTPEPVRPVSAE
jgi:glutamate synthase (NADPH/NADH) large chain